MTPAFKRYGSIYVAKNTATGDCYVGQTVKPLSYRVGAHRCSAKNPKTRFGRVLAEFGFAQFDFNEVFVAFSRDALNEAEKQFIKELQPTYNSTAGGAGAPGRKVSEAVRDKLKQQAIARWGDAQFREKTVAAIRAACSTEKFKSLGRGVGKNYGGKRWAGHIKPVRSPKDRSASMKRAWEDPVIRQRITTALKAVSATPEYRALLSASRKGFTLSKETIDLIAAQKHKPVFCPELQITFLSMKYAAEWVGTCRSAITAAVQRKGKVFKRYTFCEVN